jgi:hypothetical protein
LLSAESIPSIMLKCLTISPKTKKTRPHESSSQSFSMLLI